MAFEPKILIVEDDPGECRSLELVLKVHGYRVTTATTGSEGIKKAHQEFYHFALVDKKLPDLTGTEVLKAIKKTSPQTEVALITGYASVESAIEAIDADAVAYLEKPLNLDRVLSTIAQALQRQRQVREDALKMEELEKQNDLLESEVLQTQAQLAAMERKAYVGEFATQVVHEVRNPLLTIKISLQVLAEKNLNLEPNDQRRLDLALEKIADLENVLNDVLDFTRMIVIQKELAEINRAVSKTLEFVQDMADQRQVRLEQRLSTRSLFVFIDHSRFEQAILNLCLNAIQAITNPKGGTLTIKTNEVTLDGMPKESRKKWVQIEIKDNGCGMNPELMRHVFRPFITTRKNGTGLGLSMVKKFVYDHDGLIDVNSKPGEGTTVSLFFASSERGHEENGEDPNH